MDVEKAIESIVESQARSETRAEAREAQAKAFREQMEGNQLKIAQNLARITDAMAKLIEARHEDEGRLRLWQEENRRKHEENERKHKENLRQHKEYELKHREADEKFSALISMMDEWIRNRRNGNAS